MSEENKPRKPHGGIPKAEFVVSEFYDLKMTPLDPSGLPIVDQTSQLEPMLDRRPMSSGVFRKFRRFRDGACKHRSLSSDESALVSLIQVLGFYRFLPFQENVEEYLKKEQHPTAEHALRDLGEMLSKYNFMDTSLQQRKAKVTSQIPEFKNALALLKTLKAKKVNSSISTG